ncbi:toxin-antitoxin system HicB family antitoxin [Oceanobacter antarcticus]|jgi:plasmid stability protein|uniref:Toxin-antitoxin system HicB family antitoxin n=1 Tax=Oceanobacter antarcticus TaxID=3133425 RepID=A0ABW8NGR1_9GAMM
MSTLTVRLPDDKHNRLKALAAHRKISMNKLIEELSTQAIAEFDTEIRFRAMAAVGRSCWISWTSTLWDSSDGFRFESSMTTGLKDPARIRQ